MSAARQSGQTSGGRPTARFVEGSILRHVVSMTATGSVGLVAVFAVDALNLFYISLLGQSELAAAIGYAGTLLFFLTSLAIGLSIAGTALTSRALGRGERSAAREAASAAASLTLAVMVLASAALYPLLDVLIALLGASGETARLAVRFCAFVLPSMPLLGLAMACAAILRAQGDGRRAMNVTLGAAFATAALDPLLIFGFGLGLDGAAAASVLARSVMAGIGLWGVIRIHDLIAPPTLASLARAWRPFFAIGVPAILTQLATPVGNAFVTASMAGFGDAAVAGWAVISRLIPLAFGALFALSGAVGPIIGQNFGAGRHDRLHATLRESMRVTLVYVLTVWLLLALMRTPVADAFGAVGEARALIEFFCLFVAGSFLFNGALFVANAAFNNLGFAVYSTVLNWGRATLGVVPFTLVGGHWFGATGVLAGYGIGVVAFGVIAYLLCFRVLARLRAASGAPALPTEH